MKKIKTNNDKIKVDDSSNAETCDCSAENLSDCYQYYNLDKIDRKFIEKFHRIGLRSLKCNCNKNEEIKAFQNESCDNDNNMNTSISESEECLELIPIECNNEIPLIKSLNKRNSIPVLIFITLSILLLRNGFFFEGFLFKSSQFWQLISLILTAIFFINKIKRFENQRNFLCKTFCMIKICYFNDNKYLFLLSLCSFSLIVTRVLLKIFITFCSCFYYIIPKSRYYYLSNILGHLISFDYPELIEYHDRFFFCGGSDQESY